MMIRRTGSEDDLARRVASMIEALHSSGHGPPGLLLGVLADGGQVEAGQPGQGFVVVAGDGHGAGDVDSSPFEGGEQTDGALVVVRHDCGRKVTAVEEVPGGLLAALFGAVSAEDPDAVIEPMAAAEAHQMVDCLADSVAVRGAHDVEVGVGDPTTDGDHGHLAVELGEDRARGHRAEEDQRLAAEGQQRLDGRGLVAGPGLRAQDEVVADLLGGRVQVFDQLGLERTADVDHDAQQPAASAGEQAGGTVRAVTNLSDCLEDTLPRALTGAGRVPQHQRHGCRRHAHTRGHILQPGTRNRTVAASWSRGVRLVHRNSRRFAATPLTYTYEGADSTSART
jgi:hypothetical protein